MIGNLETSEDISLYLHIPFCSKKCPYCNFYVLSENSPFRQRFIEAICQEIKLKSSLFQSRNIRSIYFGGGTPSKLTQEELRSIFDTLNQFINSADNIEITIEINPEDIAVDTICFYSSLGINRASIGVQSFDNSLLSILGRDHESASIKKRITSVHEAGIKNISIDLMYELPSQTLNTWKTTLDHVKTLPITHLSLYNLVFEKGTPFYKNYSNLSKLLPSDNSSLKMLEMATDALSEIGLNRYEISAFSKPALHSTHNTGYWLGRDFLGLGPSAFSYFKKKRFKNVANIKKYCESILTHNLVQTDSEDALNPTERAKELFVVNLRMTEGAKLPSSLLLRNEFMRVLKRVCNEGYINKNSNVCTLTSKGKLFYDSIASELI